MSSFSLETKQMAAEQSAADAAALWVRWKETQHVVESLREQLLKTEFADVVRAADAKKGKRANGKKKEGGKDSERPKKASLDTVMEGQGVTKPKKAPKGDKKGKKAAPPAGSVGTIASTGFVI
jgi:hypothetical protein